MFVLRAEKTQLTVLEKEPVTSGSVNVYKVRFEFSEDWDDLNKTAVFMAGCRGWSVLLDDSGQCCVPWEALAASGGYLSAGVCGTGADGTVVLPTVWANLGTILEGVSAGEGVRPPTPDLWEQELSRKGDGLSYDGSQLSLKSGDKTLSSVEIAGGGGGGIAYRFGHGLKQDGLDVSVDAVNDFTGDNTLPMTAAGVQTTVGNIEALLATI